MDGMNIGELGIVGAVLVVANQALRFGVMVFKDHRDRKNDRGQKVELANGDGEALHKIRSRVERNNAILEQMEDQVNTGMFSCRWSRDEVIKHTTRLDKGGGQA